MQGSQGIACCTSFFVTGRQQLKHKFYLCHAMDWRVLIRILQHKKEKHRR